MKYNEVIPVAISILVIILVAVLERWSKLAAAVTATMPLTIPLAFWVVYSSSQGEPAAVQDFARSLVIGLIPSLAFSLVLWWAARQEWKLWSILALAYAVWGAVLLAMIGLRRFFG
jgi:hypothetical protein